LYTDEESPLDNVKESQVNEKAAKKAEGEIVEK
jgi:hypothetical protein